MKVFLSWSGSRSRQIAEVLEDFLQRVIQSLKPWVSQHIAPGARWSEELAHQLSNTRVGVICLTPENLEAPWILYEAGALSKTLEKHMFVRISLESKRKI